MLDTDTRTTPFSGFSLLRFQFTLLLVAVAIAALHWIFHSPVSFPSIVIRTFVAGNTAGALMLLARASFEKLRQPWNWIVFACVLIAVAILAGIAAELSTFFFFPRGSSFLRAAVADSPFALLVTAVVGLLLYVFGDRQMRHLAFQRELQSHVQLGLSEKQTLQSDPDQASEIQMHLLPRETPQIPGFQIACAWQPARNVSGDYFDVLPFGEKRVGLCMADVSGKGIAAALLMANLQASVKAFAHDGVSPAALCSRLNGVLCDNIAPGRFVTLFYGVLDAGNHTLQFESAGHCLPLLVHRGGEIEFPEASSGVLGLFSHWTFSDHDLMLASGDVLVLMTDGVLEAWNADEEEFGYRRLIDSVISSRVDGAHGIRKRVLEDVTAFCHGQFQDDASLIVVTVN